MQHPSSSLLSDRHRDFFSLHAGLCKGQKRLLATSRLTSRKLSWKISGSGTEQAGRGSCPSAASLGAGGVAPRPGPLCPSPAPGHFSSSPALPSPFAASPEGPGPGSSCSLVLLLFKSFPHTHTLAGSLPPPQRCLYHSQGCWVSRGGGHLPPGQVGTLPPLPRLAWGDALRGSIGEEEPSSSSGARGSGRRVPRRGHQ